MKVLIRKTAQGNEYWDAETKETLFVPVGEVPSFEVTENPKSMLLGVDFAKGSKQTDISEVAIEFDSMTIKQLKEYAATNDITIPDDVKKKEDIIKLLSDSK